MMIIIIKNAQKDMKTNASKLEIFFLVAGDELQQKVKSFIEFLEKDPFVFC